MRAEDECAAQRRTRPQQEGFGASGECGRTVTAAQQPSGPGELAQAAGELVGGSHRGEWSTMSTADSLTDARRSVTGEQTRARYPDRSGHVERDGVRVFWELYGEGEPTVLFLPTWSIVYSRSWKAQIPYMARHACVLTFDGRGNGRSDRPQQPEAYREEEFAADALAVMDASGTERAVLVSLSRGAERSLLLGADHPERVKGMVFISPALPLPPAASRAGAERAFAERRDSYDGWVLTATTRGPAPNANKISVAAGDNGNYASWPNLRARRHNREQKQPQNVSQIWGQSPFHGRRTRSHRKNGPPMRAVTIPTGSSIGARTVRATRSQPI